MATKGRQHVRKGAVSQRSPEPFRGEWAAAVRDVARRDRPILDALAAFDRGAVIPSVRRAS